MLTQKLLVRLLLLVLLNISLAQLSTAQPHQYSYAINNEQQQQQNEEKQPLTIDDLFTLKHVQNPAISPEGDWIAFTIEETLYDKQQTETRVWMVSADGETLLPMTARGYAATHPRWSPDGRYLSFMATRGEQATSQVWVLDRRGGEARQLTSVEQGISGYEWSPDGSRLLLLIQDVDSAASDEPRPYVIDRLQFKRDYEGYLDRRRTHIYTFTPGDQSPTQLTFGDFDHSQPAWSPDGTRIAFTSNRTDEPDGNRNSDIWIVDATLGEQNGGLSRVTINPGSDHSPSWSPDGSLITYITVLEPEKIWYANEYVAIAKANISTQSNTSTRSTNLNTATNTTAGTNTVAEPQILTLQLDQHASKPMFTHDGSAVIFTFFEQGERKLGLADIATQEISILVEGELTVMDYTVSGKTIVAQIGRFFEPDELFILSDGTLRQLTSVNREFVDRIETPQYLELHFQSYDGAEIHGFLIKPNGYTPGIRYPTILWNHGGPVLQHEHNMQYLNEQFEAHLFAANGYAVLLINPRGSIGYGQAHAEALFADWGNKDFRDVMAAVDYAIELGIADADRLGVGGWSYGGILTNYVITKSDRFKGAISGASETLMRSNYGHDHYQFYWETELGLPWETPEKWERISPFNDVANVVTPTLWMGGQLDWNVPILGSEQMYQAMRRLGIQTKLVVYPGEFHGIQRPAFKKDRLERYLDWFDRFVKP
jgi:dipeptidyl aminopeptidase/acylaminoacyl peptidase